MSGIFNGLILLFFLFDGGSFGEEVAAKLVLNIIHGLVELQFFNLVVKQIHLNGHGHQVTEPHAQQPYLLTMLVQFGEEVFDFGDKNIIKCRIIDDFLP